MNEANSVTLIAAKEVWPNISDKTQIVPVPPYFEWYFIPVLDERDCVVVHLESHFGKRIGYNKEFDILVVQEAA